MTPLSFRALVWRFYRDHGRHDLPWRKYHDVYRVLVSEVMLQQTQVDRVIPYYTRFLKHYPSARKLAAAPLSEVLTLWQGLGYNRRAKMLREAAKMLALPRFDLGTTKLEQLPGVGPYTARAVAAFALNEDGVVIETNIRTVIIHHFFKHRREVSDREIASALERVLPRGRAREWYSALMDYGASLKARGISHNKRVRGYTKQTPLQGSLREVRGAIVRRLSHAKASQAELLRLFDGSRDAQVERALEALCQERMVKKSGRFYTLSD